MLPAVRTLPQPTLTPGLDMLFPIPPLSLEFLGPCLFFHDTLRRWWLLSQPTKESWHSLGVLRRWGLLDVYEFKRFLITFIQIPCLIIKTGRRICYRIVGYNDKLKHIIKFSETVKSLGITWPTLSGQQPMGWLWAHLNPWKELRWHETKIWNPLTRSKGSVRLNFFSQVPQCCT